MDVAIDAMTGPASRWTLHLLGRWRLTSAGGPGQGAGGEEVVVPAGGQRLVALLALRGAARRATVSATLWPDRPAGPARATLRHTLSVTAQALPGLVVPGPGWGSGPAPGSGPGPPPAEPEPILTLSTALTVDTHDLEALAAAVTEGPLAPDDAALAALLDGPELLEGWYDDWVEDERERLTAVRFATLGTLADRALAGGLAAEALGLAEAALRLDPLREEPAIVAIRAHLVMGNPALAVRCYVELRDRFRRELGVDPDPRCLALVRPYAACLT